MRKVVVLCFFVALASFVVAQPEKAEVREKDGKKFYVHTVEQGQTLYGISKLYQVTLDQISAANPETANGLKVGQKLWVPVQGGTATVTKEVTTQPTEAPNFTSHLVEKSETLYGISKRYGVSMEQIVKYNPGTENGLTIGQELKIPNAKSTGQATAKTDKIEENIVYHTVLEHETMYSIAKRFMVSVEEIRIANGLKSTSVKPGDVLKIPVKPDEVKSVQVREVESDRQEKVVNEEFLFKKKDAYAVVLLLPFNLDRPKDALTSISTEFFMGAQLALDSLERIGLKAKIHVIDAVSDTATFKNVFSKKELIQADMVIGPFMGEHLDITARWCRLNKIAFVNPLMGNTSVLKGNPFAINAVTSDMSLMEGLAKYVVKQEAAHYLVLVKPGPKDDDLYQAFKKRFTQLNTAKLKLVEIALEEVPMHLKKGTNVSFIVPSRDRTFALKFYNSLHSNASKAGNATIHVFGTKEWVNFDDIKLFYKNKYPFHYASSNDFNYNYDATKQVLRLYRKAYNADLTKYAAQGFDVVYYFLRTQLMDGRVDTGVMNKISLGSTGAGNGKENKTCMILKQVDFEFVKVAEYND